MNPDQNFLFSIQDTFKKNTTGFLSIVLQLSPEVEQALGYDEETVVFEGKVHLDSIFGIITQLVLGEDNEFQIQDLHIDRVCNTGPLFDYSKKIKRDISLDVSIVVVYKQEQELIKKEKEYLMERLQQRNLKQLFSEILN